MADGVDLLCATSSSQNNSSAFGNWGLFFGGGGWDQLSLTHEIALVFRESPGLHRTVIQPAGSDANGGSCQYGHQRRHCF